MAPGNRTPDDELQVLKLLRDTVASGAEDPIFQASWVSREAHVDASVVRRILTELAAKGRYEEPWLAAFIRLRCPEDDRDLGDIPVGEPFPKDATCPEDGEVEIDPDLAEILFRPTAELLKDAQKKVGRGA